MEAAGIGAAEGAASAGASGVPPAGLSDGALWLAAIVLALGNFVAVLDMTIANVSAATIAGSMGVSVGEGTWIITSYSVAEAVIVPLTGFLAARFGTVRLFVGAMAAFGLCSLGCALAGSFGFLVAARVAQGLAGGPLMPMSQTLLMRIFPEKKRPAAMGLWAVTTLVAPVLGPILGGELCDGFSWPWIFAINVPVALLCSLLAWRMLRPHVEAGRKVPIDKVGLGLLVLWVGALQICLDKGGELQWFDSAWIRVLAFSSCVGFLLFLAWEAGEEHPVVDLRPFRHRGFTFGILTLVLTFGGFFAVNVTTPLWLQGYMDYTASWSGRVLAWSGVTAIFVAPVAAVLSAKVDPRRLVFLGVSWIAFVTFLRSFASTDMGYWDVAFPILILGLGLPLFFVPLTGMILGSVEEAEIASAAGLMNFLRTLAGAVSTSIVVSTWGDAIQAARTDLVGRTDPDGSVLALLSSALGSGEAGLLALERMVDAQAAAIATNSLMLATAAVMAAAALSVWIVPKPVRKIDPSVGH